MKSRQFRPQISFRHLNSPASPPPDHMGIVVGGAVYREPTVEGQTSIASEFSNKFSRQGIRVGFDRDGSPRARPGAFIAGYQRAANIYSLPPIRSRSLSRNSRAPEVPQIYICPAPKFTKPGHHHTKMDRTRSSRTYYHRPNHHIRNDHLQLSEFSGLKESIAYVDVPVTIPVQVQGNSPVDDEDEDKGEIAPSSVYPSVGLIKTAKKGDSIGMSPNTVNLNDGFDVVSALYGREISLNVALSRKYAAKTFTKSPAKRVSASVMNYLPLREVYLKSETGLDRESQARYQQEKMLRIWSWLKKLNYMNEDSLSAES